jgi:hypothetical protein
VPFAPVHITKIMALSEVYGPDKMARAIEDAFEFAAFGSDFIANILEQRERLAPPAGPLHLTRSQDLLDVELTPADSSDRLLCRSSVEDHSEVFSLFASRIQPKYAAPAIPVRELVH